MPFVHLFEQYRRTLLLDYDMKPEQFEKVRPLLEKRYREVLGDLFDGYGVTTSTHGNIHVTVYLTREVNDATAIVLQALLGSDFVRECISWWRLVKTGDSLSIFGNDKKNRAKPNECRKPRNLREFALEMCPGLVIWMSHYAQVYLYTRKWTVVK